MDPSPNQPASPGAADLSHEAVSERQEARQEHERRVSGRRLARAFKGIAGKRQRPR